MSSVRKSTIPSARPVARPLSTSPRLSPARFTGISPGTQFTPLDTPRIPLPTSRKRLTLAQAASGAPIPSTNIHQPAFPTSSSSGLMEMDLEVQDYQGIVQNASLENELLDLGYIPLSKIVIRSDDGADRPEFIKAINKNGQKVFIKIDAHGYTTARIGDLTLIESNDVSIVPYSLKTGAFNCAGSDVCGIAFECGFDSVCVLSKEPEDLTPKEANFIYVERTPETTAVLETEGSIMSYPVVRLSEIRVNPELVLKNTHVVTRRLRDEAYKALVTELAATQKSISRVNQAFARFDCVRKEYAVKLVRTLHQLEQWNQEYQTCPPESDEAKDKYKRLLFNLGQRNDNLETLLRSIKKVGDKRAEIDLLGSDINSVTDWCVKEFSNIEYANSE